MREECNASRGEQGDDLPEDHFSKVRTFSMVLQRLLVEVGLDEYEPIRVVPLSMGCVADASGFVEAVLH